MGPILVYTLTLFGTKPFPGPTYIDKYKQTRKITSWMKRIGNLEVWNEAERSKQNFHPHARK